MKRLIRILTTNLIIILLSIQILFSLDDDLESKRKEIRGTIGKIELGLKKYRIVNNVYPEDGNRNLVSSLLPNYLTLTPKEIKGGLLLDSWGRPCIYQRYDYGDALRWHTYVIYSIGPNGADEDGEGDDIGNW